MLLANENIEILDSLLLSAVSMGIIMAILFLIMIMIYLMSWAYRQFRKKQEEKAKKPVTAEAPAPAATAPAVPEAVAPGSCGELKLVKTSEADAAMIMAIVADNLHEDLNTLRFKEIRLIGSDEDASEK